MRYLDKNWYLKSQKYPPDDETYDAVKVLTEAEKNPAYRKNCGMTCVSMTVRSYPRKPFRAAQSQYLRATTTLCGFAVRSTVTNP